MAARMLVLGLVVLALARPALGPRKDRNGGGRRKAQAVGSTSASGRGAGD